MSEEIITEVTEASIEPEVAEVSNELETVKEVEPLEIPEAEDVQETQEERETQEEQETSYADKPLVALVGLFEEFSKNGDRLKMFKEAEAIKSAFYRKLQKEKSEVE